MTTSLCIYNKRRFLFGILLLTCFSALGEPLLKVSTASPYYDARPFLLYLEDPNAALTIEQVAANDDSAFKPVGQKLFKGGYSKSAYWLRLDIKQNLVPGAISNSDFWVMEVDYAALDYVDLYYLHEGHFIKRSSGDRQPFSKRHSTTNLHTFSLHLDTDKVQSYYLRVETSSSLQIPVHIWAPAILYDHRLKSRLFYGIYFGIFAIMALYNLFLYFSLQDRSYIFYVLYIVSFGLLQSSISGLSYRYLWPESPDWANINIPFFMATACLFATMFTRLFLNTSILNKLLDKLLIGIIAVSFLCALLPFFSSYETALNAGNNLTAVVTIAVIIAGILASSRGYPGAKYFLLGWSALLIGATLFMLNSTGIVPANPVTMHASEIGSSIEVLLLSLALGDRIKNLREDKVRTEQRARDTLSQANAELTKTLMLLEKGNSLKDDFLAKVSHELRTPLNGISGSVELMQYEDLSPRVQEYAKSAELSSKHMLELVNTLLKFAESQANDEGVSRDVIRLDELCQSLSATFAMPLRDKAMTLRNDISEPTPTTLIGDENKLCLVLRELTEHCLGRSLGGQLCISVDIEKLAIKNCHLNFFVSCNNSEALPEREHLLHGGLGIGMAICQQLVTQMRGTLEADGDIGFKLTLPFDLPQSEFLAE